MVEIIEERNFGGLWARVVEYEHNNHRTIQVATETDVNKDPEYEHAYPPELFKALIGDLEHLLDEYTDAPENTPEYEIVEEVYWGRAP